MSMQEKTETDNTKKFTKLFFGIEVCDEIGQKVRILEMNEIVDRMNKEEFESIFKTELLDKIHQMIEKKKMTMENALLLLKHVGYCEVLKGAWDLKFGESSLRKRFEKMIIDEEKKKGETNKMLLSDLCECFLSLNYRYYNLPETVTEICVSCILKVALKKEVSEGVQKEVEVALLALSNIGVFNKIKKEIFLNEIKEIMKYHQKHQNLTQLANQSAWGFLTNRLFNDEILEEVIVNELHFVREARREMEELVKCVDWKKKKEEERKDTKEELVILRWIRTLELYFLYCKMWNEGNAGLVNSIVQAFRAAKDNYRDIVSQCIKSLSYTVNSRNVKVEDLLKGRAIDAVFEEIQRPTLNDEIAYDGLLFLMNVSEKLKEEEDCKMEETKRKATKRKTFEKLEEEGYEDIIISFYERFDFLNDNSFYELSLDVADYFVND